jgi:type I restriction enzyme S subunit
MSFPRYPTYKPSGVEWLGEVPEHWNVDRMKWAIEQPKNGIWGNEESGDENDIPCVRVADFDRQGMRVFLDNPTIRNVTRKEREGRVLVKNDLLIEKSGGGELQPVGCVVIYEDDRPAISSNFVAKASARIGMSASYWRYLHSAAYAARINTRSIKQTSGIQNLDQSQYLDESSCYPPLREQERIATFLDHETAKIDALIAEQQRLIELLQEKRQAVISHAVTKGLNPDAPMKDSGVEWLGEVPEHWTVIPLRLAARIESGHTPSRSHNEYWIEKDCVHHWFTLGDVWQIRDGKAEYVYETQEKVSQAGLDNSAARMLPANTVILSRTASVGFSGILGVPMATTQDFVNWVCGPKIVPEFLLFVFRAMSKEFERLKYGSTHNTIYMPDIFSFRAPLPSLIEQGEIVSNVRESLRRLDGSFDDLLRSKELLQERRSALISAAVTGQIDVRGLVPEAVAA